MIAHAMSVITVQAGVGAHLAGNGTDPAARALGVIERTGRQALTEMRRMLTVLRDPDPSGPQPLPQPGLRDLADLIGRTRAAGVPVTLETQGVAPDLPPGLDLAVYRVVQEALTNVVKHAPSTNATVVVGHTPGALRVEVRNATPDPITHVEPGQGLRGMAERVALYDGVLDTGADGSTFRVSARFPVGDQPATPGTAPAGTCPRSQR